jgi:uncharacterized protein YfbU (UPF0304 family)
MKLTREQRWILANQYLILEHLHPEESDYYQRSRKVLEHGWELNYDWIAENIYERTMSGDECAEVLDILDMFRSLESSFEALADKEGIEAYQVTFAGFDGNYEAAQLGYASFIIKEEKKFEELANHGDGLNSHIPVLDTYRRMLAVCKGNPIEQRYDLSAESILAIVGARAHPNSGK